MTGTKLFKFLIGSLILLCLLHVYILALSQENPILLTALEPISVDNIQQLDVLFTLETEDVPHVEAFSPANSILATTIGTDYHIYLIDFSDDIHWEVLKGHTDTITDVIFSPDEDLLISRSKDDTILIWNMETQQIAFLLEVPYPEQGFARNSIAFSPNKNILAAISAQNTGNQCDLWDIEAGIKIASLYETGVNWPLTSIAFNPVDGTLATANFVGIRMWDLADFEPLHLIPEGDAVNYITFNATGTYLAAHNDNGLNYVWNMNTSTAIQMGQEVNYSEYLRFNADGTLLALSGHNGTDIFIWDVTTGKSSGHIETASAITGLAFDRTGTLLAISQVNKTIQILGVKHD